MKIPKKPKTPSPLAITPKVPFAFSNPGKRMKCWPTAPIDAIIATRPCLISADRSFLKPASSPTLQKPSGSKKPKGGTAPGCSAGLKSGGAGASVSAETTGVGVCVSVAARARPRRPWRAAASDFLAVAFLRDATAARLAYARTLVATPIAGPDKLTLVG